MYFLAMSQIRSIYARMNGSGFSPLPGTGETGGDAVTSVDDIGSEPCLSVLSTGVTDTTTIKAFEIKKRDLFGLVGHWVS